MSLTDEERRTTVRLQIEKAHKNFAQIELLSKAGYWPDRAGHEHAAHHGKTPGHRDDNPAAALAFCLVEADIGNDAVTHQDENQSSQEFKQIFFHNSI